LPTFPAWDVARYGSATVRKSRLLVEWRQWFESLSARAARRDIRGNNRVALSQAIITTERTHRSA